MPHRKIPNRWTIAGAAVVMQICLGAAYGWSVFVKPLTSAHHWSLTQVSLNFTLAIAFLGVGTVIGGLWQDRVGPRRVANTGTYEQAIQVIAIVMLCSLVLPILARYRPAKPEGKMISMERVA